MLLTMTQVSYLETLISTTETLGKKLTKRTLSEETVLKICKVGGGSKVFSSALSPFQKNSATITQKFFF